MLSKMIMVLLLIVPSVVRADLFGGDVAILSQMYSNMVQQLKTLREELDNIKAVNSTLKDTYKAIDSVRKEYDFWQNVDVKRDMDDVVDHYLDGTVIDELVETDDPYVRYDLAKVLIDRRTIPESLATKDNENDPVVVAAKNYVDAKGRAAYYRNKSEQAYNSKSKISDRDLAALQASAASIVASEALETRAVRLRAEIAQRERTMNLIRQEIDFLNYLQHGREGK